MSPLLMCDPRRPADDSALPAEMNLIAIYTPAPIGEMAIGRKAPARVGNICGKMSAGWQSRLLQPQPTASSHAIETQKHRKRHAH